MSEPCVGEIRYFGFNFAPEGWALCDGSLLPIAENEALFSLIGTLYGGDGQNNFALPDLRGSVPVHQGQGEGLPVRAMAAESALASAPAAEGAPATIGTLVLNPCIALYGLYPRRD